MKRNKVMKKKNEKNRPDASDVNKTLNEMQNAVPCFSQPHKHNTHPVSAGFAKGYDLFEESKKIRM